MIDLKTIKKQKTINPPRIILYGVEGIGKSTFASQAPNPIFIQTEDGLDNIEASKFDLSKSYDHVQECLDSLLEQDHEFKTLVIDSADWLEKLIFEKIMTVYNVNSIELAAGGFGKGYVESLTYWHQIFHKLNRLREEKKMAIIFTAHNQIKTVKNPEGEDYDKYSLKLYENSKGRGVNSDIREWADCVLFCNHRNYISTNENGSRKANFTGERLIYTEEKAAFDAKNRYGLPQELSLDWNSFNNAFSEAISK